MQITPQAWKTLTLTPAQTMKTAPGSRWSDKDFAFDLELMENNYFENQSLRKLNTIILTPGSQMGRGHQSEDCPIEAMLHAAGS